MSKALENIEKSVLEMYLNNPELAREELSEAGYNVESLVGDGLVLIKQLQFKLQANQNKTHLLGLYLKAKEMLANRMRTNREEALSILSALQVKVQYRNLNSFTEDELNNILKDVDIVELIEKLDKNPD